MTDVFISYSRKDKDFVRRLHDALKAANRDIWVDWEDIPATADWWREIQAGIEAANAFVFVISPDSVRSEVCNRELDYALTNNKRLIPLLYRDVTDPADQKAMHPSIGSHNWIFFRDTDDFNAAFQQLISAMDTDLNHVRIHTRLLTRAKEWDANNRNASFLLQGDDLNSAEAWLAQAVNKKPAPTDLHTAYILASRRAATARQRRLLAGVTIALIVSIALAILSLGLFGEANRQQAIAVNNAATATIAQGEAEINAATATFAQGQAQNNAATAVAGATAIADANELAQSVALAGQAEVELSGPRPERGVLLALAAFSNNRYTWQAERALASSVQPTLEHSTLSSAGSKMTDLDWSPDGSLVVTGTDTGKAAIWDINGQPVTMLDDEQGTSAALNRVRWSPDGSMIATGSADGHAQIWTLDQSNGISGSVLFTFTDPTIGAAHNDSINDMEWSPDGTMIATASKDRTVKIWNVSDGSLAMTLTGHTASVSSLQWSPDSTQLVTVSVDRVAKIWDVGTGKEAFPQIVPAMLAAWSPDGTALATTNPDNTATIWALGSNASAQKLFSLIGHTGVINRIAWSADGTRIATASNDQTARVWDTTQSGLLLRTLFGHTGAVTDLSWASSVGNPRLITVSEDETARVWNTDTGGQLLVYSGPNDPISKVSWPDEGTHFATLVGDGTARIWEVWKSGNALIKFAKSCCVTRMLTDEENIQFGLPTATVVPSPNPAPTALPGCEAALPTRVYNGARAVVTDDDPTPLNVRVQPGTSARRIAQVSPGQTFQVIGDPQCVAGLNWFPILYGIGAVQGWIAEGQDGKYFVQPVT